MTGDRTWDLAVQPTPLHLRTSQFNVANRWTDELGWTLPSVYSSIASEHAALRNACTMSDLTALATYSLRGADVGSYLNRLAGGTAGTVKVGASRRAVMCDDRGGLIAEGVVMRADTADWKLTLPVRCLDWLTLSARGFDCDIEDVSDHVCAFAVEGPSSCAALLAAGFAGLEALRPGGVRQLKVGSAGVTVMRRSATGGLGYEVRCAVSDALFVFDRTRRGAELFRPVLAGEQVRSLARLEAGHCRLRTDYESALIAREVDRRSPLELGLGHLVNLDVGPFTGKAALVRQKREGAHRALVGIELDGASLPEGRLLSMSTEIVGRISSLGWSPARKRIIGLADVRAASLGVNRQLSATGSDGRPVSARIVPRPFYVCPNAHRTPPDAH